MFTSVLIHNNSSGDADAKTLARFEEPAWNNPVVRWLDRKGVDLAPRLHRQWTVARMAQGMITALEKSGTEAPAWLRLLRDEQTAHHRGVETALFGMA